eukprot:gene3051-5223_t
MVTSTDIPEDVVKHVILPWRTEISLFDWEYRKKKIKNTVTFHLFINGYDFYVPIVPCVKHKDLKIVNFADKYQKDTYRMKGRISIKRDTLQDMLLNKSIKNIKDFSINEFNNCFCDKKPYGYAIHRIKKEKQRL